MKRRQPPTRQPRIIGERRRPVASAFTPELEAAIEQEMRTYNVTRSYAIARQCARSLKVAEQPDYRQMVQDNSARIIQYRRRA